MVRSKPIIIADKLYCIKEVCDLLEIHRDTLRKYTNNNSICCVRYSCREIYYSGKEILMFWHSMHKTSK